MLAELAVQAKEGFAKAEEEWERSAVAWGKSFFSLSFRPFFYNVLVYLKLRLNI